MTQLEKANQYIKENKVDYKERPAFHVSAPVGWINDPNGFSIYQNTAHLFFQFYPYDSVWGPMHWGHVKSDDFIKWEDLPTALAPDQSYDAEGCFSGSAIATSEGHALLYTGVMKKDNKVYQNQCLAIGDGLHYEKIDQNPVVDGAIMPEDCSREDFRDPKVWQEDGLYYMVAGNRTNDHVAQVVLFSSHDLTHWKFESVIAKDKQGNLGAVWECPDFFKLDGEQFLIVSPQDMCESDTFHNGNNAIYLTGTYDNKTHIFDYQQARAIDDGIDFYAPQTLEAPDGRRIMVAWMQSWDNIIKPVHQKWANMMTLPRELSMKDGHLIQQPVRELNQYHTNHVSYDHYHFTNEITLPGISGRMIDLTVTIHSQNYHECTISFAKNDKYHVDFSYNKYKNILELDRSHCGMIRDCVTIRRKKLRYVHDELKMRIILDRFSAEIFINDGEQVFSTTFYTPLDAKDITFSSPDDLIISVDQYDIVL